MASLLSLDHQCSAGDFGVKEALDGAGFVRVEASDPVFACMSSLPLGCSFGAQFCNAGTVRLYVLALQIFGLSDRKASACMVADGAPHLRLRPGRPLVVVYVDNGNMLCWVLGPVQRESIGLRDADGVCYVPSRVQTRSQRSV